MPGISQAGSEIVAKVKALCQAEHPDKVKMQFVCFKLELAALRKITVKSQAWRAGSPQQEIAVRCLQEAITAGNQVRYTQAVSYIDVRVGK